MRTQEEIKKWARTPQLLLEVTRNTVLLHGERKGFVFGVDRQKQFHRVGWSNDSCLSIDILIKLGVFLLTSHAY